MVIGWVDYHDICGLVFWLLVKLSYGLEEEFHVSHVLIDRYAVVQRVKYGGNLGFCPEDSLLFEVGIELGSFRERTERFSGYPVLFGEEVYRVRATVELWDGQPVHERVVHPVYVDVFKPFLTLC